MAKLKTDICEATKTLMIFRSQCELVEIRSYDHKKIITSAYFQDDYTQLFEGLDKLDYDNCYFVMNEINGDCYKRSQRNIYEKYAKETTKDAEIVNRRWILIDADPVRLSGISSTDDEKENARRVLGRIYNYLRDIGFAYPVCADSGNGYHLLYKIGLKNVDPVKDIIKNFLAALSMIFSDESVSIDTSVFNASRITKLYGTVARKGADTPERPHRLSRIIKVPDEIKITDINLIKQVADMLPKSEPKQQRVNYDSRFNIFDIHEFMQKYLRVEKVINMPNYTKHLLSECPFDSSHKSPDSMLTISANGAIGFKCLHHSCSGRTWADVRELYEPKANRQQDYTRTTSSKGASNQSNQIEPPNGQQSVRQYYQLHEIENIDRCAIVSLPTGIKIIDRKMVGFNKKEVTVISGNNGSGKSTIIGQFMLNNINNGFKCTLFSGELTKERVKTWLHLQAAGRQYTKKSEYGENIYFTPRDIGTKIDEWAKDKIFIHNNVAGTNFTDVLKTIDETISKENTDIIYIDNLMSTDLSDINGDKYERQTAVIKNLCELAKVRDVHIVLVCHPRKSTGFLRKSDISGTADLTNAVDNVIMCHRVNQDFRKFAKDFFEPAKITDFLSRNYTNCVEIMKNRDLGVEDELIGLYFEPESKRLLNEIQENINFGWQADNHDFIEVEKDDDLPFD